MQQPCLLSSREAPHANPVALHRNALYILFLDFPSASFHLRLMRSSDETAPLPVLLPDVTQVKALSWVAFFLFDHVTWAGSIGIVKDKARGDSLVSAAGIALRTPVSGRAVSPHLTPPPALSFFFTGAPRPRSENLLLRLAACVAAPAGAGGAPWEPGGVLPPLASPFGVETPSVRAPPRAPAGRGD